MAVDLKKYGVYSTNSVEEIIKQLERNTFGDLLKHQTACHLKDITSGKLDSLVYASWNEVCNINALEFDEKKLKELLARKIGERITTLIIDYYIEEEDERNELI